MTLQMAYYLQSIIRYLGKIQMQIFGAESKLGLSFLYGLCLVMFQA